MAGKCGFDLRQYRPEIFNQICFVHHRERKTDFKNAPNTFVSSSGSLEFVRADVPIQFCPLSVWRNDKAIATATWFRLR